MADNRAGSTIESELREARRRLWELERRLPAFSDPGNAGNGPIECCVSYFCSTHEETIGINPNSDGLAHLIDASVLTLPQSPFVQVVIWATVTFYWLDTGQANVSAYASLVGGGGGGWRGGATIRGPVVSGDVHSASFHRQDVILPDLLTGIEVRVDNDTAILGTLGTVGVTTQTLISLVGRDDEYACERQTH